MFITLHKLSAGTIAFIIGLIGGIPRNAIGQSYIADSELPLEEINNQEITEGRQLRERGQQLYGEGKFKLALDLFNQALIIFQKLDDPREQGYTLHYMAYVYESLEQDDQAIDLLQQATLIFEENGDTEIAAATLNHIGNNYREQEEYDKAFENYQKALNLFEKVGNKYWQATVLKNYGLLFQIQKQYNKAIDFYQKSLSIRQEIGEPLKIAMSLDYLADVYYVQSNYREAEPYYKKALAIREEILGENHPDTATSLNSLANNYYQQKNYSKAESLYQRALAVQEEMSGEKNLDIVPILNSLANLYRDQFKLNQLQSVLQRIVNIQKEVLGEKNPDTMISLGQLAIIYTVQGKYGEAEQIYQSLLGIQKEVWGVKHLNTSIFSLSLGLLYSRQGRYEEAEKYVKEALIIQKQALGDKHIYTATTLVVLGQLYYLQGTKYNEAERYTKEALAIQKEILGDKHDDVANSQNQLGMLYYDQGKYDKAELFLKQALATRQEVLGNKHIYTGVSLNSLAVLYASQGKFQEAESLLKKSLAIYEEILGTQHPQITAPLSNLGILYQVQNNIPLALDYFTRFTDVEEENLLLNLAIGSERNKQDYIKSLFRTKNAPLSFHLQAAFDNPQATRLAMTHILRRKGRILDTFSNSWQTLRVNLTPENQKLLDELSAIYSQIANFEYDSSSKMSSGEYKTKFDNLNSEKERLEATLSARSEEFRQQNTSITIEKVQNLIPSDAALVEIVRYQPLDLTAKTLADKFEKPHYAVYILFPNGEIKAKDIGEAKDIEQNLAYFRTNLLDKETPIKQLQESARQLDAKLMQPIRQMLGGTKTILLSPDGALNLIPFEALVDENNQYLVENYKITYLTSGRDLLRLKEKFISEQPPLILANPSYTKEGQVVNLNPSQNYSQEHQTRSVELSEYIKDTVFLPLSGTEQEAEAIQNILQLPQNRLLTGQKATEDALKQVRKPTILHIATHGFFRESQTINDNEQNTQANPLLYSGLVLAGVKADIEPSQRTGDDGILTALETTALNLVGTKLVVLSACDTGRGDITTGEGIYGLRRALVIAGSESQLISLWKVSDKVTKDLMVAYYERLRNGKGRSEALRNVQLEMLKNEDQSHPFYWAGFIPSGDWTPMEFNSAK